MIYFQVDMSNIMASKNINIGTYSRFIGIYLNFIVTVVEVEKKDILSYI